MKKLNRFLSVLLLFALLTGCGATAPTVAPTSAPAGEAGTTGTTNDMTTAPTVKAEAIDIRVATLKGPTGMGMAPLMIRSEAGETHHRYRFAVAGSPDEVVAKILQKEVDIAAVPSNLASVLYNKSEGQIQLMAVNTLGVLYVLENGAEVQTIQDLSGKVLISSGKGATPDYLMQYLLAENKVADVTVDFKSDHSELVAAMVSGDVKLGLLPEPFVTTALQKNPDLRVALDLTQEWEKTGDGSPLTTGVVIVQKDFAEQHREALVVFLSEYAESVEQVNADPEQAGAMIEKAGIMPSAALAAKAIPRASIVMIPIWDIREGVDKMLQVLYDSNPKSVGGKLPDEGFYFKAE